MTATPNHALQRLTAPCVTAPASAATFPPAMQVPRRTPRSLSLGSRRYAHPTMKAIKALLFTAVLSLAHASAADTVWSASEDNGDKPGIGFRLVQGQRGISGAAYLLDPNHAHDFSHGTKRKMTVTHSTTQEVRFKLDWGDGKQRSYILVFDAPLDSKPVTGTLQEDPADGEPSKFTFKPTKSK